MIARRIRLLTVLGTCLPILLLAGCGGTKPQTGGSLAPPIHGPETGRETIGSAIDLLNRGKSDEARAALTILLRRQPGDQIAASLLKQISSDPVALLGRAGYDYTVKPGDTLSELAGRFLGNPTLFYALGRYNHLNFPVTLANGQVLRIPGEPKVVKPAATVERPHGTPKPAAPLPPKPVVAKPAPPPVDPNRATNLRAAALEQLNRGQVNRAVILLQQAAAAAPGNPLIKRDLDRALRIRSTIHP